MISIITITHNSEDHIEQTIRSIINQKHTDIEYIIIDGASEDSTLDIINKYHNHINFLLTEPDKGIADAMNKGLEAAKGDYILFLHSDDYLIDETSLEKASHFLDSDHDIFLFNLYYSNICDKTLATPRGFNWWINFKTGVLHQSCLCSKKIFTKIGKFDTNFKIAMDYDFFLRAYRAGAKAKLVNIPLSVMRRTGISSRLDWLGLLERFEEEKKIQTKNCPNIGMRFLYTIYWKFYLPYRYIMHFLKQRKLITAS
jgi:glycosyltransferase involved in cell wall biosynthesis